MLKQERQAFILHQVNLHNQVMSAILTTRPDTSTNLIHRDLKQPANSRKPEPYRPKRIEIF